MPIGSQVCRIPNRCRCPTPVELPSTDGECTRGGQSHRGEIVDGERVGSYTTASEQA